MKLQVANLLPFLFVLFTLPSSLQTSLTTGDDPPQHYPPYQDVFLGQSVTVRPLSNEFLDSSPGVKKGSLVACTRLRIPALSRFRNVNKYAGSFRVKVEALSSNYKSIHQICFHWNESLAVCQCSKDSWKPLEKASWDGLMSPFETRFIDIRTIDSLTGNPLTVSVVEEFWSLRLFYLGVGFLLLLAAPLVSSWVPFYYSSAMTLGILLVILILLYQGMKLLPTGRKSTLYVVLYGSVVGMGTVFISYFTGMVSSALRELGFGDEMYNPVVTLLLVGIVLLGAWLGYWGVRKMVLSEDGDVDVGVARFVKWAMRLVGCVMILQSSQDPVFAVLGLILSVVVASLLTSLRAWSVGLWEAIFYLWVENVTSICNHLRPRARGRKALVNHASVEFRRKSDAMLLKSQTNLMQQSHPVPLDRSAGMFGSPVEGSSSQHEFYSSFHKTPGKRKMSNAEWHSITKEYTEKSIRDLAASPKFKDWFVNNADRVVVLPTEHREDRSEKEIQLTASALGEGDGGSIFRRFFNR